MIGGGLEIPYVPTGVTRNLLGPVYFNRHTSISERTSQWNENILWISSGGSLYVPLTDFIVCFVIWKHFQISDERQSNPNRAFVPRLISVKMITNFMFQYRNLCFHNMLLDDNYVNSLFFFPKEAIFFLKSDTSESDYWRGGG